MKNFTQKFIGLLSLVFTMSFTVNSQEIGDVYQDGYIFYIDETGEHGLVAAMGNFNYEWGCHGTEIDGAYGTAIGTGYQNTLDIVAGCSDSLIAASVALAYESEEGYSDWYLPSLDELIEMYNTIGNGGPEGDIGGLGGLGQYGSYWYWSSSQTNNNKAWDVNFQDGQTYETGSKYNSLNVRPIRSVIFGQEEQIDDPCTSLSDYNSILLELNPIQSRSFNEGWNMFGFPCKDSRSVSEIFSEIESDLYIIKNNEGNFYWPEFDFDGIGELTPLEGYQIKLYNSISAFSFCDYSIDFPIINGCTDCEACNFNPFANSNDNSCVYKNLGYDCFGEPTEIIVGQKVYEYDGFVLYYDSIDQKGLIASNHILDEGSSDPYEYGYNGYEWGCFDISVLNEDEQGKRRNIGYGKQNTQDILDMSCLSLEGGITAAQACSEFSFGDFSDWFLPSLDELNELLSLPNIIDYNSLELPAFFWSSTESDYLPWSETLAKHVTLSENQVYNQSDVAKNSIRQVIPIHAFGNWTEGCMDWMACNHTIGANMDDGSCQYPQEGYDCDGNFIISPGDNFQGGIVYYIDESGEHGLIAAPNDLADLYEWGCNDHEVDGADEHEIGFGLQNTNDIINDACASGPEMTAAEASAAYENDGYNDWHLPSRIEMQNFVGFNVFYVPLLEDDFYWTSTEESEFGAWKINHITQSFCPNCDKSTLGKVRPVRYF